MLRKLILFWAAVPLAAQPFGLQLKAGIPVTGYNSLQQFGHVNTTCSDVAQTYSNRYLVGVAAEFRLPRRLAVEVDALYRRVHLAGYSCGIGPGNAFNFNGAGGEWGFHFLAKYRFLHGPITPFLTGGPAARRITLLSVVNGTDERGMPLVRRYPESHVHAGYSAGGGVDFRFKGVRISPEIRYTNYRAIECNACSGLPTHLTLNPVELMLGIGF